MVRKLLTDSPLRREIGKLWIEIERNVLPEGLQRSSIGKQLLTVVQEFAVVLFHLTAQKLTIREDGPRATPLRYTTPAPRNGDRIVHIWQWNDRGLGWRGWRGWCSQRRWRFLGYLSYRERNWNQPGPALLDPPAHLGLRQ